MSGLLLKDLYTLGKQMRFFILFIVVFCVVPQFNGSSYAIVYATMLTITSLAYDERSKWNVLAATMPYKKTDIVFSKYLLGYIMLGATSIFAYVAQTVICVFKGTRLPFENVAIILTSTGLALLLLAVIMPFMMKFGVEKGRIAMMIFIAFVVASLMILQTKITTIVNNFSFNTVISIILFIVIAIIMNCLSVIFSVNIKDKK